MAFVLRPDAADATTFSFELTRGPETVGSWYRPLDGALKFYDLNVAFNIELPSSGQTLDTIMSGEARITNFSLPGSIAQGGVYFSFTSVPSLLVGSVSVSGNLADIVFPAVSVDFMRGTNPGDLSPGTLNFTLTTGNTTIPSGCAGRVGDQVISGVPLNLTTGSLGLVASVCPYQTAAVNYDNAFRLQTQGSVLLTAVPEPGTFQLLGGGLLLVLAAARRKSTT